MTISVPAQKALDAALRLGLARIALNRFESLTLESAEALKVLRTAEAKMESIATAYARAEAKRKRR